MSDNLQRVTDFVRVWAENDLEKIMGFFHEECVYHNIPMAPVSGLEAIRTVIQGFTAMAAEMDWVLHAIAESENGTVLTERTDRFLMGDKWVELPVMGSFELRDGQIVAWRDYFDMQQFQKQLPGA